MLEARTEMAKLGVDSDDANYRNLKINLAISMGDWNSVLAFIASECQRKRAEKRSRNLIIRLHNWPFGWTLLPKQESWYLKQ